MANIKSDSLTLVVGLGNRDITPDSTRYGSGVKAVGDTSYKTEYERFF